ncbi:hypothetical protein C1N63_21465 [Pantoea ananatis]|nr:hypothetical protein C1N63_00230 [Pantoea ananatis]AWQ21202.1 hypothetical protein C1N63_21465 [Pantoea ananatis]
MSKKRKVLIYAITIITYFLVIPEIILRTLSPEHLSWLGFLTSFGGLINPLLSVMIFMGVLSIVLAIATIYIARKFFHFRSRN